MLSMLNQLTPDRRQRATDYVAQLLELQRAQGNPLQQPAAGPRRNAINPGGGRPWAARGQRDMTAAAPPKSAMHVSGHLPGYDAAEYNETLAHQPAQHTDPLSPLRLNALQPRPQEALEHMVTPTPPTPPELRRSRTSSLAPDPSPLAPRP